MGENKGAYSVSVGNSEGRRPLGRPRRRWKDNIKIDIKDWDGDTDWIDLAQDKDKWWAVVNAIMNLRLS
jgi:hypothetical protein